MSARFDDRRPASSNPRTSAVQPALGGWPGTAFARWARCLGSMALPWVLLFSRASLGQTDAPPPDEDRYVETVTVTATRLIDRQEPAREVPAAIVVIDRDENLASGVRTLQEALSRVAGGILFDQVGNGIQTTFDLRGFSGGGITVLIDGARVNDPRNNAVQLETIDIGAVDRIEIVRGAAAATVGGGSAAGVVNVVTRAGAGPASLLVSGAWGSDAIGRASLEVSGRTGARAIGTIGADSRGERSDAGGEAGGGGALGAEPAATSSSAPGGRGWDRFYRAGEDSTTPAREGAGAAARAGSGLAVDWLLRVSRDRTDGFRENSGGAIDRATAGLGLDLPRGSRLSLTLHGAEEEIGTPGALTLDEWDSDPEQAPFNALDDSDLSFRQGTLNWRGPAGGAFSVAANLSYVSRDATALTTGRGAATFGGFLFDSRVRTLGGALQSTASFETGAVEHTIVFGAEGQGGTSDADGCGTKIADLGACDPSSFLNSRNRTRRSDTAIFAQDSLRLGSRITLLAGGRWDRTRLEYRESEPDPSNDRRRTFTERSWKGGVTWNPAAPFGLYAAYGESFQPPTVEDLFSFPGFGSNPDLEPVDARNYEVGARGVIAPRGSRSGRDTIGADPGSGVRRTGDDPGAPGVPDSRSGGARRFRTAGARHETLPAFASTFDYALTLFRTNLANEIVFDPTPLSGSPFGRNENAGASRREGLELTAGWRIFRWLSWSFAYARTRATFENGPNEGNEVPLVPKNRYSETTEIFFPAGIVLRVDLLHVGDQVLSNDAANGQRRLGGYRVVDGRILWRPVDRARGAGRRPSLGTVRRESEESPAAFSRSPRGRFALDAVELFVEGRNLLDERYATRGIYAFDFSTFASSVFVTPAPGRRFLAGASLTF